MFKRFACVAAMLVTTGIVCGAAVQLCDTAIYNEPDPDADAKVIMNYVAGVDKTHVTVGLHRFTPYTTYTLVRITAGSVVTFDSDNGTPGDPSDDWWLVDNTGDYGWFIFDLEGDLTTNKKGHLLFHETYPGDYGPRDLLVFAAPVLSQVIVDSDTFKIQGDLRAWCVECQDDDD
jgi:hypothetical protein